MEGKRKPKNSDGRNVLGKGEKALLQKETCGGDIKGQVFVSEGERKE